MTNELIITLFCIAMVNVWGAVDTTNTQKDINYMVGLWIVFTIVSMIVMFFKE